MKSKAKFICKNIVLVLTVALILFGCGTDEIIQTEDYINTEPTTEAEKAEVSVQVMLETAEESASALQKKLSEDSTLTQSDMNQLSYEIYKVWDDLLNELWDILENTLDEKTMQDLLEVQREWITMKEAEVKKAGEEFAGGSMAPLASNQKAAELTKTRVYELATHLGYKPEN